MNPPTFQPPDAESELLLRFCAAPAVSGDRGAIRLDAVDWDRFLALANRNSVTPMIGARLAAHDFDGLPSRVARALQLSYEANAMRCRYRAECATEIAASFDAAGVPAIALKGPALAIAAYGDVATRVFGDLDFIVRLRDLDRAAAELLRLGYSSTSYRPDVIASGFFPDVTLNFTRDGSIVDLHWRLSPTYFPFAPDGERVWTRTATIDILGTPVRTLGPADAILFQACHGSKHGWTTLAQISDFARMLDLATPDICDTLIDEARRTRSLRMLLLGVELADSLTLCNAHANLVEAARRDSSVTALAATVRRRIFDLERQADLDDWSIALKTVDSMRDRITYVVQRMLAPKISDHDLMPLPRPLYPLYYVARPILLAIKHGANLLSLRRLRTRPLNPPEAPLANPDR
jgi:Uncharacterised nucleotidyltransferase